jgi:hypothetical protein
MAAGVGARAVLRARAKRHGYDEIDGLNGYGVHMLNQESAKKVQARKAEIQWLFEGAGLANCISASWEQLARLLAHVARLKGPPEYKTSDEDAKWLIARVTKITKGQSHSWQDWQDKKELKLQLNHVAQVLPDYLSYLEHSGMIEEVFNRFDTDRSGVLEKNELKEGEPR